MTLDGINTVTGFLGELAEPVNKAGELLEAGERAHAGSLQGKYGPFVKTGTRIDEKVITRTIRKAVKYDDIVVRTCAPCREVLSE